MNRSSLIWAKRAKPQLLSCWTWPISLHWSPPKVSSCPALVIQLSPLSLCCSEKPVLFALTRAHVQGRIQDFESPSHPLFSLWTCPPRSSLWGFAALFPVPDYKDWILMRLHSWRPAIRTSQLDESEAIGYPSIPPYIYSRAWLKTERRLSPLGSGKQTTRLSSRL